MALRTFSAMDSNDARFNYVLRLGDNYWRDLAYLEDIPIGRYTASAALVDGDARQPLSPQKTAARHRGCGASKAQVSSKRPNLGS